MVRNLENRSTSKLFSLWSSTDETRSAQAWLHFHSWVLPPILHLSVLWTNTGNLVFWTRLDYDMTLFIDVFLTLANMAVYMSSIKVRVWVKFERLALMPWLSNSPRNYEYIDSFLTIFHHDGTKGLLISLYSFFEFSILELIWLLSFDFLCERVLHVHLSSASFLAHWYFMRELVFISVDCLADLFQLRDLLADLFLVWFEGLVFLSDEEGTES